MQLCEPEPVGTPHHHRVGARNVEPRLDDVGREQNVPSSIGEGHHDVINFGSRHLAMGFDQGQFGDQPPQSLGDLRHVLDPWNHHEALPPTALFAHQRGPDPTIVKLVEAGADGLAPCGRSGDDRYLLKADQCHLQRTRNRGRAE